MEQAAPLVGDGGRRKVAGTRRLVSCVLLAGLIAAASIFCTFGLARPVLLSAAGGRKEASSSAVKLGRLPPALPALVQAFALQQGGRVLTDGEIAALLSRIPKGGGLLDGLSMSVKFGPRGQDDVDLDVSDACAEATQDKLDAAIEHFAQRLSDVFFGCLINKEGPGCKAAEARIESFPADLAAKCQATGDFCVITPVGQDAHERAEETQTVCAPAVCHPEAKKAIEFFKVQLGERIEKARSDGGLSAQKHADDCGNCTAHIECGAGGLATKSGTGAVPA